MGDRNKQVVAKPARTDATPASRDNGETKAASLEANKARKRTTIITEKSKKPEHQYR